MYLNLENYVYFTEGAPVCVKCTKTNCIASLLFLPMHICNRVIEIVYLECRRKC